MANISYNDIAKSIYLASKEVKNNEEIFFKNVINFLKKRKLILKSKTIISLVENISNKENGILVAEIESPVFLEEEIKNNIAKELKLLYQVNSVIFNEKNNPKLLGGLKIKINDEIIDLSISNKLQKLQKHLIK